MAKRTNSWAWRLVALLAAVVLGGVGLLCVRLDQYWTWYRVARDHGPGADLHEIVLPYAALRDAHLSGANLERASLWGANLAFAHMGEARLASANLGHARLAYASLFLADLSKADLRGAILRHACMWGTNLPGAQLQDADLRGAKLPFARLKGADLAGADLRGAILTEITGASYQFDAPEYLPQPIQQSDLYRIMLDAVDFAGVKLTGARYDVHTRWPAGFDPRQHGAVLVK
jgi:uncharacterized protein YjbI with pentapeptide repeats